MVVIDMITHATLSNKINVFKHYEGLLENLKVFDAPHEHMTTLDLVGQNTKCIVQKNFNYPIFSFKFHFHHFICINP